MAIDKNVVTSEAQKYAAKGQFDKAIAEWKKLLKESPNDANIFNTIGDLCLKKDSKPEAVDAYKKAADILASDGFTSKAIALYKKVLNIDPKKIEVHLALADMNAEKGLTGNALESYKLVADHYAQNKQQDKALGIYQKMADLNPSNISFRLKLADMYAKEGMKKDAITAYLAAADIHVSKGAFKDARQIFEKALTVDPNSRDVYHMAGIVYFKDGKFVEACKSLKPVYEADPSNKELLELYSEALAKAGRDSEAEELYKKLVSEDPSRIDLREKLFQLYIGKKEHAKALNQAAIIAEERLKSRTESAEQGVKLLEGGGERELDEAANAALERLKELVAESPGFADAKRTLGDFYAKVGRGSDAARELAEASEILINEGAEDDARAALARAIELAPDFEKAKKLLEGLQSASAEPEPAAVARQSETANAADFEQDSPGIPERTIAPEDSAVVAAITEAEVLIKYGLASKAIEQLEGLARTFPESVRIRIKLRDLYGDQGELKKAASHMLVLSDIYEKQGQHEAVEAVLRETLELDPQNNEVRARLGIQGSASAPPVIEEPVFEPAVSGAALHEVPSLEMSQPPRIEETFGADLDQVPSLEVERDFTGEPDMASADSFIPGGLPGQAGMTPDAQPVASEEISFNEPFTIPEEQPLASECAEEPEPESKQEPPKAREPAEKRPAAVPKPSPAVAAEQPAAIDLNEVWAEAEFYYQQGLFDEAKKHYAKIIQHDPGDERAITRLSEISREAAETHEFSKLAEAVDGLGALTAAGFDGREMQASTSDDEAVRLLMQEIAQLKQNQQRSDAPIVKPPSKAAPLQKKQEAQSRQPQPPADSTRQPAREQEAQTRQPQPPADSTRQPAREQEAQSRQSQPRTDSTRQPAGEPKGIEEDFFDLGEELRDETAGASAPGPSAGEDFFDLASELRDELNSVGTVSSASGSLEDQSLDDIFDEFKKGVEQQAVKEDVDTHYNLGVAYKEMGLLDDAIAEFILTPEEEPKFIQSRSMLGLCYMEKGDYQSAINELQSALALSQNTSAGTRDLISLRYDLALAYQGAGDRESALAEFQKVHAADAGYRERGSKIQELQQSNFISLEQLKDDIEKEISSKFFEEGERIEREEKIRKSDKVRN